MVNKKWDKEKILEVMKKYLSKDEVITLEVIKKYSKQGLLPNRTIIYRNFGNLYNACKEIGLKCNAPDKKHIIGKQQKLF